MSARTAIRVLALSALVAAGAMVSAEQLLPSAPPRAFGASVTPAFEGWFDNADGTHTFLIGYFNRNTAAEPDVPIGPANHFEPGTADMGQPTHFLTGRRYGMFAYTVPKEFGKNQKLTWSLTVNGVTSSVPFYMSPDYNVTPLRSSEQGPHGYNLPPLLRFNEGGPSVTGPLAQPAKLAAAKTAAVGVPMALDLWVDDDGLWTSGTNAPMTNPEPPVSLVLSKYRGPGNVTFGDARVKVQATKGGKPDEAYSGKASTTVKFSEAGDYLLHVTANDYSGNGGGGSVCCWTTGLMKVEVKGMSATTTGGQ